MRSNTTKEFPRMRSNMAKEIPLALEGAILIPDDKPVRAAVQNPASVNPIIRRVFYIFVFSILFEGVSLNIGIEPTTLAGGLLVLVSFTQPQVCFRHAPAALWCFAAYLYVGVVSLVLQNGLLKEDVIWRLFVVAQLMFMFWIAYNLMLYEPLARNALICLTASCAALAVLQYLDLAPQSTRLYDRSTRFMPGMDPNLAAGILGLGLLALVGLAYGVDRKLIKRRFLIWPVLLLVGPVIIQTGSRGGLLALAAGLSVFILKSGAASIRLRNLLIVSLVLCFFTWVAFQSDTTRHRIERTLESGDVTTRDQVYRTAWEMFLEKPLMGWGPVINTIEIGERMQMPYDRRMDTHNLVLYVMTATGVVGSIAFFTGMWMCVRAAWGARGGVHGILPFAMTVLVLISDMSVSGLHYKPHWFVMAYALASGSYFASGRLQRGVVRLRPPVGRSHRGPARAAFNRPVQNFNP